LNIQEILKAWEEDSVIDKAHLDSEALKGDRLHCKYMNELVNANMMLAKTKTQYNKLILEKYIFYTEGAKTIKDIQKAPRGAVLKSEAEKYILGDEDVIKITLDLALYQEKIDTLKSIMASIAKRSFTIKNTIDFMKFQAGC
jgi:hypothetical protein